jgi:hypothetical protein
MSKGTTITVIHSYLDAYSFVLKFFDMVSVAECRSIHDVMKYIEKTGTRNCNQKAAFGESELLKTLNCYLSKFGPFEKWPLLESRTFILAMVQTITFCRYSEIQNVEINDVMFHPEYFKILIKKSKTDQQCKGEYVYLPKVDTCKIDCHMMFCKYLQKYDFRKTAADSKLFSPLKWRPKEKCYESDYCKTLSYNVALKNFKCMLELAGFDPKKYGLHSPRIGATTDAFFNKLPDHVIDQRGRWKIKNSKFNYLRMNEKHFISALKNV